MLTFENALSYIIIIATTLGGGFGVVGIIVILDLLTEIPTKVIDRLCER